MQFPVYLWLGPLALHPHPVFEALGYLVGARLYGYVKARTGDPIEPVDRWWIVAAAFLGAALGSKLLVLADHPPSPTPLHALYPQNRQLTLRLRVFLDWIVDIFGRAGL